MGATEHCAVASCQVTASVARHALAVAILDSGATHHLWPFYDAFVSYTRVDGQFVTLVDDTRIPIKGRGTVAVELGGKKVVIRDVYHMPAL